MKEQQHKQINSWFTSFVAGFTAQTAEEQRNYDLKIEHTARVRAIMERLAASLNLSRDEQALASIIAICHDVGRFPQYRQYGTFNDAVSANHAALAVQTLKEEGVLDPLDEKSRLLILQAVALHNVFNLPDDLDPYVCRFAMLIRDADKLDILRVLIEYFSVAAAERASAVVYELPETGLCSEKALEEVIAGRMINRTLLTTADDFKLLQLSWAYDLNFNESFTLLVELGYIETLAALLPDQSGCKEAATTVRDFVKSRVKNRS